MKQKESPSLKPELYDKDYYRKSLHGIEYLNQTNCVDPAIEDTIRFGGIKAGDCVLDFGTGWGTLPIALAQKNARPLELILVKTPSISRVTTSNVFPKPSEIASNSGK